MGQGRASARIELRQLTNSQLLKLDRRAFRLQAEVTGSRTDIRSTGYFLAIDPQANFAIDATDVVVIPLADALAQVLRWKTPLPIRRHRRKRFHRRRSGW